jgi:ketol-acid reductoisomerase
VNQIRPTLVEGRVIFKFTGFNVVYGRCPQHADVQICAPVSPLVRHNGKKGGLGVKIHTLATSARPCCSARRQELFRH